MPRFRGIDHLAASCATTCSASSPTPMKSDDVRFVQPVHADEGEPGELGEAAPVQGASVGSRPAARSSRSRAGSPSPRRSRSGPRGRARGPGQLRRLGRGRLRRRSGVLVEALPERGLELEPLATLVSRSSANSAVVPRKPVRRPQARRRGPAGSRDCSRGRPRCRSQRGCMRPARSARSACRPSGRACLSRPSSGRGRGRGGGAAPTGTRRPTGRRPCRRRAGPRPPGSRTGRCRRRGRRRRGARPGSGTPPCAAGRPRRGTSRSGDGVGRW